VRSRAAERLTNDGPLYPTDRPVVEAEAGPDGCPRAAGVWPWSHLVMDPWQRQLALARVTVGWCLVSTAVGVPLAARGDRWWRAFGRQQVGWAAVDAGVVVVAELLRRRRMRRAGNPYAPAALRHERRVLRRVLAANATADALYVAGGAWLWRANADRPERAGAGAGIVVQGTFLCVHDTFHALRA
jgi:hypothetical protein